MSAEVPPGEVRMLAKDVVARAVSGVAAGSNEPAGVAVRAEALRLLLTRFPIGPKHLARPGPRDEELSMIALAALMAFDHNKLIPFRFVVARGEALERLAELFGDYGRRRRKTG